MAMHDLVTDLVAARRGHFVLESGHHGELWLELDAVFWSTAVLDPVVEALAERLAGADAVCGPLVGGAFLAQLVAARLGVGFAYTERVSAGNGALYSARYGLPAALGPRLAGLRVAVVDDVINAGSAATATVTALAATGAEVVAIAAMLALGQAPARVAAEVGVPLEAAATLDNEIWAPTDCPRCARGEALDRG